MNILKLIAYVGMASLLATAPSLHAAEFKDSKLTHIEFPAWFVNDPFLELNALLAQARAEGKQGLMVFYSTEGCSYCGLFVQKSLHDPAIVAQ